MQTYIGQASRMWVSSPQENGNHHEEATSIHVSAEDVDGGEPHRVYVRGGLRR